MSSLLKRLLARSGCLPASKAYIFDLGLASRAAWRLPEVGWVGLPASDGAQVGPASSMLPAADMHGWAGSNAVQGTSTNPSRTSVRMGPAPTDHMAWPVARRWRLARSVPRWTPASAKHWPKLPRARGR